MVPAAPWRSTGATIGLAGAAGHIGEHTTEVLSELLGLDDAELEDLRESGVIR
jgi:crotonobetainyl-CoA:carnitine CoA-transferase CaiB-like acyl-CoA transferase